MQEVACIGILLEMQERYNQTSVALSAQGWLFRRLRLERRDAIQLTCDRFTCRKILWVPCDRLEPR